MSATATAPAAPSPAPKWLAAPAGDWKTLSAAMTAQVPPIAGRPVPVACAPGAGLGSPACYLPAIPVIEVDGTLLGTDPAGCDPASPADRERYPVTWGALIHECAHAAHTRAPIPPEDRANWCQAARQLEESRIEARQVTRRPGDRRWLRAVVTRLILADFTAAGAVPASPREVGTAAALVLARADAGILEPAETAPVAAQTETVIGAATLTRLQATWREFHKAGDSDLKTMARLARRWCRILGLDPDAPPPAPIPLPSVLAAAIAAAAIAIDEAAAADFTPPPPGPPAAAEHRERENRARGNAERAAREVFGRRTPPPAVTGTRDPGDGETAAARRLARALREATAGGRTAVTIASPVPPGRLRMGKALSAQAQRAAGAIPTAEPFTRSISRRSPAPPLRVGIACDISSSMSAFAGPVASAAWILARAAAALPCARTAAVLFGKNVHALTRPGETPAKVTVFRAPDGTEQASRAIDALDGALGLSRPGTARLLVIVTDAIFVAKGEPAGVQQRITRLHRAGCGVILLVPHGYASTCKYTGCQVTETSDPAAAIDLIARAATRALTP
jgi:hypothetical protein